MLSTLDLPKRPQRGISSELMQIQAWGISRSAIQLLCFLGCPQAITGIKEIKDIISIYPLVGSGMKPKKMVLCSKSFLTLVQHGKGEVVFIERLY